MTDDERDCIIQSLRALITPASANDNPFGFEGEPVSDDFKLGFRRGVEAALILIEKGS